MSTKVHKGEHVTTLHRGKDGRGAEFLCDVTHQEKAEVTPLTAHKFHSVGGAL